ncbi:MAG: glycine oxidase ThiO [Gemmatales bacterium]
MLPLDRNCDICIVGGGVIGLTLAYLLAKEMVSVTLIDKSDLGQEASWAGAGILPAGNPAKARSPIGKWRAQAVSFFPHFSAELKSLTGIDNGYWQCGGLELRASASQLEEHRLLNLAKVERGEGLMCEIVDAKKLHQLEPKLSPALPGGVYFPGIAQIRNPWHLKALIEACRIKGVNLLPHSPCDSIERLGERITGIRTPSGTIRSEKFVIAAGTWTTGLLAELGWQPAMKPIKGQIVLLHPEQQTLKHILLVSHQYLVPRQDGRILIGSTEEDVGFDKNTTEEASTKLRSFGARLMPSLADAPIEKQWSGLRPGSSDGRPFLGLVPNYQNLFVAAGHFRAGLQHSIMTGIVMRDVLLNQANNIDISPFKPDRTITKPIPWIAHAQ